ncbi:hypothetical protein PQE75_gp072 [Bacillus phage vB_BcoS-136]|uniref:Uncharacterized protein n=1 Tax=Bacillus phage vB_BcoS-136 TaxID=2419619 RepID=A0A3G3BVF7_9CAUD|nr:hypothetical protein PQE75_gp072 [Bacillus phage vB_BcoS-136]AYP68204.1 hypothetical protein vBBcoS136_00072 [Bacillus phage vB_BcoS-136]
MKNVLLNGIVKFDMDVQNDFEEAQRILDISEHTSIYDSECVYSERVKNSLVGTYEIGIARKEEYERFIDRMEEEKNHFRQLKAEHYRETRRKITKWWREKENENELTKNDDEFYDYHYDLVLKWFTDDNIKTCECKLCKSDKSLHISFEEWKSGKMSNGAKVGKTLRKHGYSQELLDFYSLQDKTEEKVYFTISGNVQHIAGMSNYVDLGSLEYSFDGFGDSSCQDTRHDDENCRHLGGALHDNKLFVGMMHFNKDDVYDMQDKLIARVLFRLMEIDGKYAMIPSLYYGNNKTKSMMHYCLTKLEEATDIYSKDIKDDAWQQIEEVANGALIISKFEDVHIREEFYKEVECECPVCDGGTMEIDTYNFGYVSVECVHCGGSGEVVTTVSAYIDEWKEVEREIEVYPYPEGFSHTGDYVRMYVSLEHVRAKRRERVKTLKGIVEEVVKG